MRLLADLFAGLRGLRRNPGVALVAAATLAIGIGASTTLWSLVVGVLLRELPYRDAHSIVRVFEVAENGRRQNLSQTNFDDLRESSRSFSALALYANSTVAASGGREAVRLPAATVSREFFSAFSVQPVLGRGFTSEELRREGPPALLVSDGVWRDVLGAPVDLSAASLTLLGETYAVVGVLPRGFDAPGGARVWLAAERFPAATSRTALNWQGIGRLRDGVSVESARAELGGLARRLRETWGDSTWMVDADVVPLRDTIVARARTPLWLLLGGAMFLLLVACANVANLQLARATARRREVAVRRALGAGSAGIFSTFLGEALVIALAGGVLGLALAQGLLTMLAATSPNAVPRLQEVGLDAGAISFALGIVIVVALALAAVVTFWSAGTRGSEALSGGRGETSSLRRRRVLGGLAATQIALAMVLLGVAGLLGRSVLQLMRVDPGYETAGRVLVQLDGVPEDQRLRLATPVRERLAALPGVEHAGVVSNAPLTVPPANGNFLLMSPDEALGSFAEFERLMRLPGRTGSAFFLPATAEYFSAMSIPLVAGRSFRSADTPEAPHVALISQSVAEATWPGQDPLGRTIQFGNMDGDLRLLTVVGVVGDTRHRSLAGDHDPLVYVHLLQRPAGAFSLSFVLATRGEGEATVIAAARGVVREMAPEYSPSIRTYETVLAQGLADRSFLLRLVGGFALAAVLLAVAAVSGVASFGVARRRRELGVRAACGAAPGRLLRLVLDEQAAWLLVSLPLGMLATWAAGRALRAQLFGVEPTDAPAILGSALLLAVLVLLATAIPARRASHTSPAEALRQD